ncbi:MAG TPA: hypothetical protein VN282_15985 [Pyrinomonadaceae bacterium]|nr:hypothetical protein [Pyrinomonadaceae bacterium]
MDGLDESKLRVLGMFDELGKSELDLHELFEAGGNDPEARLAVFHDVEWLVERGLLEERGNDFYALTESGRRAFGERGERADTESSP